MVELKALIQFDGYFAGSDGFIYSTKQNAIPRKLMGSTTRNGYKHVILPCEMASCGYRPQSVHRLICTAWHGVPKEGQEVSHLDGNRTNNIPSNLTWETRSRNLKRKIEHGTDDCGYRNSRASLTQEEFEEVKALLDQRHGLSRAECVRLNITHKKIAEKYGVSRRTIGKIATGDRYVR